MATRSDELTRVLKLAYEAKNFDAAGAQNARVLGPACDIAAYIRLEIVRCTCVYRFEAAP
jgi:hypothetical protein